MLWALAQFNIKILMVVIFPASGLHETPQSKIECVVVNVDHKNYEIVF